MTKLGVPDTPAGTLIDAGLDAAGVGWASGIWKLFFPGAEPMFSDAQMKQLEDAMAEALSEANFKTWSATFEAVMSDMNEYIQAGEKDPVMLADIQEKTLECAAQFKLSNALGIQMYVAAMSLHIAALKIKWEKADEDDKISAGLLIGEAAFDTLNTLIDLEASMIEASVSVMDYCHFKIYTTFGAEGEMPTPPQSVAPMIGSHYREDILKLVGLVERWSGDLLPQVKRPTQVVRFFELNTTFVTPFWNGAASARNRTDGWFYKVSPQAPENASSDYKPLGDLFYASSSPGMNAPVPYIRNVNGSDLVTEVTGWASVWDDAGSQNPNSVSTWWGPAYYGADPCCIASVTGFLGSGSIPPALTDFAALKGDAVTLMSVGGGPQDNGSIDSYRYDEDCIIYAHPQFGEYGLFWIFRSHSRPDPDTVACLNMAVLGGHPYAAPHDGARHHHRHHHHQNTQAGPT
ncbi:hypothetical protein [Brevundimonas sp.]|uniref:hypothetical protein n=1 Tax=Brevundimonas sp. TaxID=1871086 RepID=UPI002D263D55|nr:hypothetical protein [Brevundimonas sp.]HYC99571.1 hypothetical protein [Brevundimonas sp.]